MTKIQCDSCEKEFELNEVNTGIEQINHDVERHYIECPECKKQYTSYYLNSEMKVLQHELRKMRGKLNTPKQRNKYTQIKSVLEAMNKELMNKYTGVKNE